MDGELGLVHVYSGTGKGKTSAALGLALRAMGHGIRTLIVQFMKTPGFYSEARAAERLDLLDIFSNAPSCLIFKDEAGLEDIRAAQEGLSVAKNAMSSGVYGLVVLDEVNVAVKWGLVTAEEVVGAVRSRREGVEVVLTGRYAPPEFVEIADYVTDMECVKHPHQKGITSRPGIDR